MIEAYPLYWPEGQGRVPSYRRKSGRFEMGFASARDHLVGELGRMGAREVIVSTNVKLRRDGLPLASENEPDDPAVAVYFTHGKRALVIACDSYTRVRWNMRACGATVEALRTIQRHGATELLERAFTGFTALPPKGGEDRPWWEVLGVDRDSDATAVKDAYRRLATLHHPDAGGEGETMSRINVAYDTFQRGAP